MADAVVNFNGKDLFDLGSNFKAGAGSKKTVNAVYESSDSLGDSHEKFTREEKIEYSCNYEYVGSDIATDLTHKLAKVYTGDDGDVLLDSMVVSFAEKSIVQVSMTGHNHTDNAHTGACGSGTGAAGSATEGSDGDFNGFEPDLDTILGATAIGSEDCPDGQPFANSNANASQISLNLNFSTEHIDVAGADGKHFVGKSYNGQVSVNAEFVGIPVLTTTGWTVNDSGNSTGGKAFDGYSISASKKLARITA